MDQEPKLLRVRGYTGEWRMIDLTDITDDDRVWLLENCHPAPIPGYVEVDVKIGYLQ